MKVGGWRPATERGVRIDLRCYITPALGVVPLAELNTLNCQQFIYSLAKRGLSEPVIVRCRTLLKAVCEMALDMEILRRNPAKHLTLPDCKVTPKPTLPKETLRTLLGAITDPRDHLILLLGVFCAVRPSELFGLTWGTYDGDKLIIRSTAWNGRLYEGKTKTHKSRAPLYLPSVIRYEIERWRKLCPDSSPDALMLRPRTARHSRPVTLCATVCSPS
jgi:integrase